MKIYWCLFLKIIALQVHLLLRPLYLVLNFLIYSSSLSFLTNGSTLCTFSYTATLISLTLCPGRLKWAPLAFERCLLATYVLCSLNLSCIDLSDSPMYCILHFWHVMQYMMNCQNPTQLNSTQNNSKATSVGVRHSSQVFHPPHPTTTTNFPATSRPARELKFGTDTH